MKTGFRLIMWNLKYTVGFFLLFIFVTTKFGWGAHDTTSGCIEHERHALLRFKHSLISDPSHRLSSWQGNNCCHWQGVGCDKATGYVTRLHLGSNLSGPMEKLVGKGLNSSLAELTHLSYLDLSGNNFCSYLVPEFIGSMTHLRFLNLSSAGFSGIVPHRIGNLSSLLVLDLSHMMDLVVDDFVWASRLLSLKYLDLSGVISVSKARNFDKVLLYMIPSLLELHLPGCHLSNSHFEFDLGSNLTLSSIQRLDLGSNLFEGEFPLFLQNLTRLRVLDLSFNKIHSSIPIMNNVVKLNLAGNRFQNIQDTGVWNLCQIKWLDLSFNQMEGGLTMSSTECTRFSFETLVLSVDGLSGEIPASLERLSVLEGLYLDSNQLTGTIPESLGSLKSLGELHLFENQLSGPIPKSFGKLTALRELDLSSNMLNGTIPSSLGQLSNLEILYLNLNLLSSIPFSLGNLSQLQFLDLSSNLLQGSLPDSIGQLSKLQFLDISNNSLGGVVNEAHFANASMLKRLDATSNHMLNFKISPAWLSPFQINHLLLGSCKMAEFPGWIRTQRNLVILILSNCSMTGPLPDWLRDLPVISVLDLSHNFLSGPLTNLPSNQTTKPLRISFIRRLPDYGKMLRSLLLKNNLFNGSIPDSLCNATDLVFLDLSRNMLSGNLPPCLGNLQELLLMILSSNKLSGVIPSSLGNHRSSLHWLLLNNNSFHGEPPATLANCSVLNVLDLGENNLSGSIPTWIGEKTKSLVVLRLHNNNFTGRIPTEMCQSSSLEILDLGDNSLEGRIPQCFQMLVGMADGDSSSFFSGVFEKRVPHLLKEISIEYETTMKYVVNMDLSSNNLVGEIPVVLTSLSGLLGLNLSNNHLTGRIPDRIGAMNSLVSLDLSVNNLYGMIPMSMSALTFLTHLNLSHNNLSGPIPTGGQLQPPFDPSIFAGNDELCGIPLPKKCPVSPNGSATVKDEDGNDLEKIWIYAITSGFTTGFMGILGFLLLKRRCRPACFL